MDNIFVERLWRSLKYENVYLHAYAAEARAGIGAWLHFYNEERLHQAHGYRTPRQIYEGQCPWGRSAAPTDPASPVSRAKSGNREMLTDGYGYNRKPAVLRGHATTATAMPITSTLKSQIKVIGLA
jgi:putative transposase